MINSSIFAKLEGVSLNYQGEVMGLWSGFKKGLDFVFYIRPKQWVSWDFFKKSTGQTISILKDMYKIPQKGRPETFYQALARHNLSIEDLDKLKRKFYYFSMFFFTLAIGMVIYAADGLYQGQILRSIGSFSLVAFLLAQAFRYHFWYFQIVQKKLGCSFSEWIYFIRSGV